MWSPGAHADPPIGRPDVRVAGRSRSAVKRLTRPGWGYNSPGTVHRCHAEWSRLTPSRARRLRRKRRESSEARLRRVYAYY
jgi:hypothetical protein